MTNLDSFDIAILDQLQSDSTQSLSALAEAVGLSTSPCWRRVKRMQDSGVINRQVAILDPAKLGLMARAYVHVSLLDHREGSMEVFTRFVEREDSIIACSSITGDADYWLEVITEDAEALETFLMKRLLATGVVRSATTNFVLRQIKKRSALPLPN